MTLPVDTLLQGGKYKIVRFISSGGFGCTYEAIHVNLGERVAIKEFFVKDFCNRDETTAHITVGTVSKCALVDKLRRKFVDEAKALYKLKHNGIVRVSDVFEENGTAYYVMDYVDGLSLGEMVKQQGAMSEQRALHYIRQVAEALQYVHDHNRLHLDIKPGNIMVDSSDNAVLIDFGASKQYDEEAGENTSTLMGKTPGYAPVEQMGNDVVRFLPATDIYALGATLYKLLTGITPLSANMLAGGETLDPLPEAVSPSTRRAIAAAMQLRKVDRPQTIGEFIALLDADQPAAATAAAPESEETVFDEPKTATAENRSRPLFLVPSMLPQRNLTPLRPRSPIRSPLRNRPLHRSLPTASSHINRSCRPSPNPRSSAAISGWLQPFALCCSPLWALCFSVAEAATQASRKSQPSWPIPYRLSPNNPNPTIGLPNRNASSKMPNRLVWPSRNASKKLRQNKPALPRSAASRRRLNNSVWPRKDDSKRRPNRHALPRSAASRRRLQKLSPPPALLPVMIGSTWV